MNTLHKFKAPHRLALAAVAALALSACGANSGSDTGTLSLSVTDAPVDNAARVVVQFSSVEVFGSMNGSQTFTFDTPRQIDLLALQGSASATLLDNVSLPAGSYQWVRLGVDTDGAMDTYLELNDGTIEELTIPSGAETGLKLVQGFDVSASGSSDFTIDFDLRKSVHQANNSYRLRPALRMMDNSAIGHISGNVDGTLLTNNCGADTAYAVYAFEGADISPDDTGSTTEAVTTSLLDEFGNYELGYLNAGDYTLALTCQADQDDPAIDDVAFGNTTGDGFIATANVTVTANQTTRYDFQ